MPMPHHPFHAEALLPFAFPKHSIASPLQCSLRRSISLHFLCDAIFAISFLGSSAAIQPDAIPLPLRSAESFAIAHPRFSLPVRFRAAPRLFVALLRLCSSWDTVARASVSPWFAFLAMPPRGGARPVHALAVRWSALPFRCAVLPLRCRGVLSLGRALLCLSVTNPCLSVASFHPQNCGAELVAFWKICGMMGEEVEIWKKKEVSWNA